ncbi:hypothetical protein QTG54_009175 [Skeletonema marinoi]|uniref:Uncharacterized protein n=1 Tax=Skeletonema marinoi TaxID=267567 RepID=A0AAD8Y7Y1_9STRA|nr:hypothetical protein QTG54_009175 [Skeletonema marinoi]
MSALPTTTQVSNDDFMKQLGHASQIIPVLHPEDGSSPSEEESAVLLEVLQKQFAHSDGIRGFSQIADDGRSSVGASRGCERSRYESNGSSCMHECYYANAMSSIHQDPELKDTADNGIKILRLLKGDSDVVSNCKAIYQVSSDEVEGGDDLIEYWNKFFSNYKYGSEQKADISRVIKEFC